MLTEPTGNKAAVAFSDIPSEVVKIGRAHV